MSSVHRMADLTQNLNDENNMAGGKIHFAGLLLFACTFHFL